MKPIQRRRRFLQILGTLCVSNLGLQAFQPSNTVPTHASWHNLLARSRVIDPDGPTPEPEKMEIEEIDANEVDGLREVFDRAELPHPIPHQPWRRGETAGCEAPINAEWRRKAEREIYSAVDIVGGKVLDVTWYLTTLLVTIDDTVLPPKDLFK